MSVDNVALDASTTNEATKTTAFRGLWFETTRHRWRVRLYSKGRIYHLSYHHDYREAIDTLIAIQTHAPKTRPTVQPTTRPDFPCTTINRAATPTEIIKALRARLAPQPKKTLDTRR